MRPEVFKMIDRVVTIDPSLQKIHCQGLVPQESSIFEGHFPGYPIMPGVLLIEAMAQTAAVLAVAGLGADHQGHPVYFMSIDSARFRRPVRPGDQLRIEIAVLRGKLGVWKFDGKARCDGAVAAEAQFNAKITYR